MLAHRRRAEKRRDVLRDAAPLQLAQVLRQRRPGDVELEVAHLLDHPLLHRVVQRAHRAAFAEDLRGHALTDLALRAAVDEQRLGRPRQHVDEARRDREARGVDRSLPRLAADRSPTAAMRSPRIPTSARTPGLPRAVVDRAAADDGVERLRLRCRRRRRGEDRADSQEPAQDQAHAGIIHRGAGALRGSQVCTRGHRACKAGAVEVIVPGSASVGSTIGADQRHDQDAIRASDAR